MATKIRLARHGAKRNPFYRIVIAHSESPRNGKFIEVIGTYDPFKEKPRANFKQDRLTHWLKTGAIPTLIVKHLIKETRKVTA